MKPEEEVLQYKKENEDLKQANAEIKARLDRSDRVAKYGKTLHDLQAEGWQFSVNEEILDCADFSQEQFDKHVARIKKNYAKEEQAPTGEVSLHAEEPRRRIKPGEEDKISEKELGEILHYVRAKGVSYDEAVQQYRKAN